MFNLSNITSQYRAKLIFTSFKNLIGKNDTVLDIGCGTGVVAFYLGKHLKIRITGCDIKNYLIYPLPFALIKENKKLPFKDKSYDVVMLNDVLHHIEEPSQYGALKEALRVGKRVLVFEVKPTFLGKLFDTVLNRLHYGDLKIPLTFRNASGWEKVFKRLGAGYKTISVESLFFYPFSHIAFSLTQSHIKPKNPS